MGNASDLDKALEKFTPAPEITRLKKSQLLTPGFIDTHIHAVQYPNAGLGYDKPLLEWLDRYTYKLEGKFNDHDLCHSVFDAIVVRIRYFAVFCFF